MDNIDTTDQIAIYNEQPNMLKEGKKIIQKNDFFNQLNEVMQDSKFRAFYDKYFKDATDIKTVILYMKLYEKLETEYLERNGKQIEDELLVYMIKQLMTGKDSRKHILNSFHEFFEPTKNNKPTPYLLDII